MNGVEWGMSLKIAIFGGSFNPVHLAHEEVVQYLLDQHGFDKVIVVPSFDHPFGKNLAPFSHRLAMCQLVFEKDKERVIVSDVESRLGSGPTFSFDMVTALKKEFIRADLSLVVGSDCQNELSKWYRIEELKNIVSLVFVPRPGFEASPFSNISSSEIRQHIENNQPITALVHPKVEAYIQRNNLYS